MVLMGSVGSWSSQGEKWNGKFLMSRRRRTEQSDGEEWKSFFLGRRKGMEQSGGEWKNAYGYREMVGVVRWRTIKEFLWV